MNIIVGCEESQAICLAFRAMGHNAYSCDLQQCSGGYPEFHFCGSIWDYIKGGKLTTQSGEVVNISQWDMLIGHPPCTYLSSIANTYFSFERNPDAQLRWIERYCATEFFCRMYDLSIPKICLENPVGFINGFWPPDQIIDPSFFGDADHKRTCLWMRGLPKLIHVKEDDIFSKKTHVDVEPTYTYIAKDGTTKNLYFTDAISGYKKDSQKLRSKTFPGIAMAMATQWG